MAARIDREELRQLVRDVLRTAIPESGPPTDQPGNLLDAIRQALLPGHSGVVTIDGDLNQFAQVIVHAAAHEDLKTAIMSGRLSFKTRAQATPAPKNSENPVVRGGHFQIENGVLNELRIAEIGKKYTKVVLGPDVVVTPLARDRARELKLELVRSKP
ncbi:MAG TPA: hypothetical protein VH933_17060 [Aestuariivirgaceae bacterium]|jgi:hypothetical protein